MNFDFAAGCGLDQFDDGSKEQLIESEAHDKA